MIVQRTPLSRYCDNYAPRCWALLYRNGEDAAPRGGAGIPTYERRARFKKLKAYLLLLSGRQKKEGGDGRARKVDISTSFDGQDGMSSLYGPSDPLPMLLVSRETFSIQKPQKAPNETLFCSTTTSFLQDSSAWWRLELRLFIPCAD